MVGTKRKSAGGMEVPSKRARPDVVALTEEDLSEMSKEELVQHALELQSQLQANVATIPTPPELSAEELAEKAQKAKHILVKGIEKQMKWTPSCKMSKARFTYDGQFQDERVFKTMLGLPDSHVKKMFKMPAEEFQDNVGYPVGRVRYSQLSITGGEVNVRWSPEERTYKVSGTYGV